MKTLKTGLFIVALLLFGCGQDDNPLEAGGPSAIDLPWLHTEGNRIVDENGDVRILRGVNRSGLEYDKRGAGIDREEIEFIVDEWKAQIIRLPFNQDWYTHDEAYQQFMDEVIGWIAARHAYVLLDLQWQDVNVKIPPIPNKAAVEMWQKIAKKYADNPAVLYDIHNEAHNTTWSAWRARATEIIQAIQAVHPKALIFVSGLDWAYDLRGWQEEPLPFENIVYSTHPYPFKSEPWAWDKYFGDLAEIRPVFAGEFGGEEKDLEWGRKLLAYFDTKKMGWTAWSWKDWPRLTESDLRTPTVFGQLVKSALIRHATGGVDTIRIFDVQAQYVTQNRATITWQTDVASDSRVYFGLTTAYSDTVYVPAMLTAHTVKLTNLQPATTYHYKVESKASGMVGTSEDYSFTTLVP